MNILFCHDGPLNKDESDNYYGIAHNDTTFKRYYTIADKLKVVIRTRSIKSSEASERLSLISVKPFEVISCPSISSVKGVLFNKKTATKIVSEEVKRSDYIVARLPSFIGNLAVDFSKKYNKPYVIEVVTCPWDAYWNHSINGKLIAPFMYLNMKTRVKRAPYVLYVTNTFLQRRYPTTGKSTNCSNVALIEFDDNLLKKRKEKITKKKQTDKIVIGTTAAVNVKHKGQQHVIKALGKLKKQGICNYEYQLVGGGDQSFLESVARKNNVSEHVKFLGSMQHNKVFEWLETIDIYSQPSRQEGLPRGLIEAMSRAVPSFGARTAGIPELLDDNFIFSNTGKNIKEITNILKSFNKDTLMDQANRNFQESKKYDKEIIEERRREFFEDFSKMKVDV